MFNPISQTWPEFKEHFGKAYENHIASGAETAGDNYYYGAANTNDTDDDSLQSIRENFTTIQVVNNADSQIINKDMSAMAHKTADLRAALCAIQWQLALMMSGQANASPSVAWSIAVPADALPHVAYATPPSMYRPLPPHTYGPIPSCVPVGRQGGTRGGQGSKKSKHQRSGVG